MCVCVFHPCPFVLYPSCTVLIEPSVAPCTLCQGKYVHNPLKDWCVSQPPLHQHTHNKDMNSRSLRRERSSRPPITTQWKIFHQTLLGYDHMVWKFIYLRKSFLIRPTTDDHARDSAPGIPCAHRRPTSYHTKHQFRVRDSFECCAQR